MTGAVADARLVVSELFGPTLQGEGPSAGRLACFVRLSNCNLACRYCDTPYTWQWHHFDRRAEQRPMAVAQVLEWARNHSAGLFVITGGEPMLQPEPLGELVAGMLSLGAEVEIETNGTVLPPAGIVTDGVLFNVSPKLSNAGMPAGRRIRGDVLRSLAATGRARFKFVARRPCDLEEIAALEAAYGLAPVWVMPEGTTDAAVLGGMRALADAVIARGWHLTPRLHVLLWGDVRGR
jgi:organic radical activating enzyme